MFICTIIVLVVMIMDAEAALTVMIFITVNVSRMRCIIQRIRTRSCIIHVVRVHQLRTGA